MTAADGGVYLVSAGAPIPLPQVANCYIYSLVIDGKGDVKPSAPLAADVNLRSEAANALDLPGYGSGQLGPLLTWWSRDVLGEVWRTHTVRLVASSPSRHSSSPCEHKSPTAPFPAGVPQALRPSVSRARPSKMSRTEAARLEWTRRVLCLDSNAACAAVPVSGRGTLADGLEGGLVFETKDGRKRTVTEAQLHVFCNRVASSMWVPIVEMLLADVELLNSKVHGEPEGGQRPPEPATPSSAPASSSFPFPGWEWLKDVPSGAEKEEEDLDLFSMAGM